MKTYETERKNTAAIPRLLTVDDVSEILGFTRQGVYSLVYHGKIGGVLKISRRALRFDPEAFLNWLAEKSSPGIGPAQPESAQDLQPSPKPKKKKLRAIENISGARVQGIVDRAKREVL